MVKSMLPTGKRTKMGPVLKSSEHRPPKLRKASPDQRMYTWYGNKPLTIKEILWHQVPLGILTAIEPTEEIVLRSGCGPRRLGLSIVHVRYQTVIRTVAHLLHHHPSTRHHARTVVGRPMYSGWHTHAVQIWRHVQCPHTAASCPGIKCVAVVQ